MISKVTGSHRNRNMLLIGICISFPLFACRGPAAEPTLRIAFCSYSETENTYHDKGTYIINPDGAGLKKLYDAGKSFVWSADGKRLLILGARNISIVNADGSKVISFAAIPSSYIDNIVLHSPAWSPDGKQIVFLSVNGPDAGLVFVNADGSDLKPFYLPNRAGSPFWSPDGQYIAFSYDREHHAGKYSLFLLKVADRVGHPIVNDVGHEASWSPDSQKIAFEGLYGIYTVNIDGSEVTALTDVYTDSSPAWSPDGKQIAFVSIRDGNDEIYVMNSDGSNLSRLTDNSAKDFAPAWSPDSQFIAFLSDRDGNREIYVMNADGSNQKNITNSSDEECSPQWQPQPKP